MSLKAPEDIKKKFTGDELKSFVGNLKWRTEEKHEIHFIKHFGRLGEKSSIKSIEEHDISLENTLNKGESWSIIESAGYLVMVFLGKWEGIT